LFQGGNDGGGQDVFDEVGVAINMIGGDIGLLDEEEFPEAMGADDLLGRRDSLESENISGGASGGRCDQSAPETSGDAGVKVTIWGGVVRVK